MSTDITPSDKEEVVPTTPNPTSPRKKLSRRKVIALAGTGTLILVAGGGVWRACSAPDRGPPTSPGTIGARRPEDH